METLTISLTQAILIGLTYWFATCNIGYTLAVGMISTPLVAALPLGIIMGNVPQAMIIGAYLQMIYIGVVSGLGGIHTVDKPLATAITIPIALATGMSPELAMAVALPFGILGANISHIERIIFTRFAHKADEYAEDANMVGIARCATIWPLLVRVITRIVPVAMIVYLGPNVVQSMMDAMPERLLHGLAVAGGLLPAMGFGLTLKVIGRKDLLHYFFAGFFLLKYSNLDIMAAAIFGVVLAFMYIRAREGAGGATDGN